MKKDLSAAIQILKNQIEIWRHTPEVVASLEYAIETLEYTVDMSKMLGCEDSVECEMCGTKWSPEEFVMRDDQECSLIYMVRTIKAFW
jgi:hypothetical protein